MTTATICIDSLRIHARHGALPQERIVGAWFSVQLQADFLCSPSAYLHDRLEGTVNYASVVACIQEEMQTPSALLEHAVHRTGNRLMAEFPQITRISLTITKENPPLKAQCGSIGVKMLFSRA